MQAEGDVAPSSAGVKRSRVENSSEQQDTDSTIEGLIDKCKQSGGIATQYSIDFMGMVADRFQTLEAENFQLREQLRDLISRKPSLHLLPDSRYTVFSDGAHLVWELFDKAAGNGYDLSQEIINDPVVKKAPHTNFAQLGYDGTNALDEDHWNAVIWPSSFSLVLRASAADDNVRDMSAVVSGEAPCKPVTLRDLVRTVKETLSRSFEGDALDFQRFYGLIPEKRILIVSSDPVEHLDYVDPNGGLQMIFKHPRLVHRVPSS